MKLKTYLNYIRYSGAWVGFVLNPCHWRMSFEFLHPDELNPKMRGCYLSTGPLWVRLVCDDGTW